MIRPRAHGSSARALIILEPSVRSCRRAQNQAQVSGPKFSPPEADANRQARPTESATRGRSFRHPLLQAICGSGTRLTATRQSIVDFKSKVKYYFSLDVVVVGPCGLREER